jgi:hypothetical protein
MTEIANDDVSLFLSYLQKRMDFIAQVATAAPSWCLLTNFDALIDGFTDQHCLINHIIRSHQGIENGPEFEPEITRIYPEDTDQGPQLDIPHGEIGAQAFYTILENIVRNTAKYGDPVQLNKIKEKNGDGKLRFSITVDEVKDDGTKPWADDFYRVQIIDHLENRNADNLPNQAVADKLNGFLSEFLTDATTGVVKPKNWGMKEIKICAAYLRMVKQEQIDELFKRWSDWSAGPAGVAGEAEVSDKRGRGSEKPAVKSRKVAQTRDTGSLRWPPAVADSDDFDPKPPIIQVSLESLPDEPEGPGVHLTYTLYLFRPKQAMIVSDAWLAKVAESKPETQAELRGAGIEFFTLNEFLTKIDGGHRPRHTFIVLPKPEAQYQWSWLWQNLNFLPPRVLISDCKESEIPPGMPQLSRTVGFLRAQLPVAAAPLLEMLWSNWVKRWWGNYQILVRDGRHASTIAEEGRDETWDEPEQLPTGQWLAFDHAKAQDKTKLYAAAAYHQGFRHGTITAEFLSKKNNELIRDSVRRTDEQVTNYSRLRVKETAALSVAVIDERVWLEKDGEAPEGVQHYTSQRSREAVWRKRRVYLLNTNEALKNFQKFVDVHLNAYGIPVFDFIIIHQGIVDGIKEKETEDFDRPTGPWRALKNRARWMVIDSGRGQPEQARDENLRWVEYSNLAECLVQYAGDKFRLAELLWTLRASSRNGGPA